MKLSRVESSGRRDDRVEGGEERKWWWWWKEEEGRKAGGRKEKRSKRISERKKILEKEIGEICTEKGVPFLFFFVGEGTVDMSPHHCHGHCLLLFSLHSAPQQSKAKTKRAGNGIWVDVAETKLKLCMRPPSFV